MTERETFRDWLRDAIAQEGETKRGLAKKIAEKHPEGATESTIESARTTLRRILGDKLDPTQPTRDAIQQALGRSDAPRVEDEETDEPVTHELVLQKIAEMEGRWKRDLTERRRDLRYLRRLEQAFVQGEL